MRLHEEFGISVSDDTVYRALKDLGFSHVSARPRAYRQDGEDISPACCGAWSSSSWKTSGPARKSCTEAKELRRWKKDDSNPWSRPSVRDKLFNLV